MNHQQKGLIFFNIGCGCFERWIDANPSDVNNATMGIVHGV